MRLNCARVSFRLYRKEISLEDHGECLTTSQLSEDRAEVQQHQLLQTLGVLPSLCLYTSVLALQLGGPVGGITGPRSLEPFKRQQQTAARNNIFST